MVVHIKHLGSQHLDRMPAEKYLKNNILVMKYN